MPGIARHQHPGDEKQQGLHVPEDLCSIGPPRLALAGEPLPQDTLVNKHDALDGLGEVSCPAILYRS